MLAHSQYCMSGDHTVEATEKAMESVIRGETADQYIVVVVSDANFARYGIIPQDIDTIMVNTIVRASMLILEGVYSRTVCRDPTQRSHVIW